MSKLISRVPHPSFSSLLCRVEKSTFSPGEGSAPFGRSAAVGCRLFIKINNNLPFQGQWRFRLLWGMDGITKNGIYPRKPLPKNLHFPAKGAGWRKNETIR